jgi:hypothetical protein
MVLELSLPLISTTFEESDELSIFTYTQREREREREKRISRDLKL